VYRLAILINASVRDLDTPNVLAVSCAVAKRLLTLIACAIDYIIRHGRFQKASSKNNSHAPDTGGIPPFEKRKVGTRKSARATRLAAAAGAAAVHAFVATAVADHDRSADVATGSVSHVDHVGEGVGGVHAAGRWSLVVGRWDRTYRAVQIAYAFGRWLRLGAQVFEEELLLSAEEAHLQPTEDVIHDRLGIADVSIAGPAARLEARVREFFAEQAQRHSVLQGDGDG
jgi:hypothetical protein